MNLLCISSGVPTGPAKAWPGDLEGGKAEAMGPREAVESLKTSRADAVFVRLPLEDWTPEDMLEFSHSRSRESIESTGTAASPGTVGLLSTRSSRLQAERQPHHAEARLRGSSESTRHQAGPGDEQHPVKQAQEARSVQP